MGFDDNYIADRKIRNIIHRNVDPRQAMEEISDYVLRVVGSDVPAYGYVVSMESLGLESKGWIFATFVKIPGEKRVYVSNKIHEDRKACLYDCENYLKNFPLYMFADSKVVA